MFRVRGSGLGVGKDPSVTPFDRVPFHRSFGLVCDVHKGPRCLPTVVLRRSRDSVVPGVSPLLRETNPSSVFGPRSDITQGPNDTLKPFTIGDLEPKG